VNYKVSQFTAELMITFVVDNEKAPSISFNDVSIQLNRAIYLNAVASGYPFPSIRWFKDGVELETRDRYILDGTSLFIDGTQSSDTGEYMVLASNGVGSPVTANATISLGTNSAAVIGSVGGIGGFLFLTSLCILFYVLIRQKQRKEYVPPIDAKTPHEEQIENRIWNNQSPVSVDGFRPKSDDLEDKRNSSVYLNPVMHQVDRTSKKGALPPLPSRPPIMQGTLIARDSDVSGPSTETSRSSSSSSSSSSDSDSGSANSKKKIIKKKGRKTKRVAPMDIQ